MSDFYDGTKLLSLKDMDGNTPEIFICTSNRSAGKTTYFSRLLVNRFKKQHEKFGLIYRYNYELDDCADKFFKEIGSLFFSGDVMTNKRRSQGVYHELYLNDVSCGYALALNNADQIKKLSHFFKDCERLLFDEFQSETNHYCGEEVKKFRSIHTSIARGGGKMVRYLPVIMVSNPVSLINPYYIKMGIASRLKDNTHFLRGKGFVLEQGFNETASKAQITSAFNSAFGNDEYMQYTAQGVYLNDNKSFIERPEGFGRYLATLRFNNKDFGIREYNELGVLYCDDRPDNTFKTKLAVTTSDHNINYVMLKNYEQFISIMRYFFEKGCFRFKDLQCKEAVLTAISY